MKKWKEGLHLKNTKAILIKFAITFGVLLLVLTFYFGVSLINTLIISVVLTLVAFVGDKVLLPKIGGVSATAGDLVLAFLVIWALGALLFDPDISVFSAALLSSLFIAGGEFYYHKYLVDHLFENEMEHTTMTPKHNLVTQTEFSEDFDKGIESNKEKQQDDANMS
ncbi:DUF2512 family protein [Lysinibacillus antri]|uniref:DUF2512 family protein n=1 Tax=Lysinibacillus antri TaxID=2498145 RepID=A0A3S0RV90_9BACI|nr:DUF2512 family protein [Lysinibacillus antri]